MGAFSFIRHFQINPALPMMSEDIVGDNLLGFHLPRLSAAFCSQLIDSPEYLDHRHGIQDHDRG